MKKSQRAERRCHTCFYERHTPALFEEMIKRAELRQEEKMAMARRHTYADTTFTILQKTYATHIC